MAVIEKAIPSSLVFMLELYKKASPSMPEVYRKQLFSNQSRFVRKVKLQHIPHPTPSLHIIKHNGRTHHPNPFPSQLRR